MNENQKKFKELWLHVSPVSDCMTAIYDNLVTFFETSPDKRILNPLLNRIAKTGTGDHWIFHGSAMVLKVEGEWHIMNSDLCFWRDICFFGRRDYFPDTWDWLTGQITDCLHQKRTYQTLIKYQANGGISNNHRKLLERLHWGMNLWRGDGCSLMVGGKRPFGNSGIEGDMFEILEWDGNWEKWEEDGYKPVKEIELAWELFDECQFAIIDALKIC